MIKFYKNIKDYAEQHWICRQYASKLIREGKAGVIEVPKGAKFIWITIK